MSNSPVRTSNSTPRKAMTLALPLPYILVTPVQRTAISQASIHDYPLKTMAGSSRITLQMLSRAAKTQMVVTAAALMTSNCHGRMKAKLGLPQEIAEERRRANPQAVPDAADHERLQHDHPEQCGIGCSHGFQRTKVAEIIEREVIKRLTGNSRAHDKPECYGDAKINPGIPVFSIK